MKHLYGDSLRKDAGLAQVLKTGMLKNTQVFTKHRPEIDKVSKVLKRRLKSGYGKAMLHLRIYFVLIQKEVLMGCKRDPKSGSWCRIR